MDGQNTNIEENIVDLDAMSPEELREYLSNPDNQAAPKTDGDGKADDDAAGADETLETADDADGDGKPAEGDAAAKDAPKEEEIPDETPVEFTFTEDADAETFRAEADEFLEMVDFKEMPQLEQVINHYREAATAAEEKALKYESWGEPETVERTMRAFSRTLEFRRDEETGNFVPDTSGIVDLLNKDFKNERQQIILDLNTQPSEKYAGLTVFQEFMRDSFDLDEAAMVKLETFFENGGNFPVPRFTPLGVNEQVAEAYWKSLERDELQTRIEMAVETIKSEDSTPTEKQLARNEINAINAKLAQVQRGLDAEREMKQKGAEFAERQNEQIEAQAETSFIGTVDALSASLSGKIAKALPFVEGTGAEVVADGFVSLVRQAYSERDWEATAAQTRLAAKGITHDWGKGRGLLDQLFENEQKLAKQLADKNTNPRAIENTQRAKANILRDLRREELQIVGRITQTVVKGSNQSLDKKLKDAPKFKAAIRKISGDGGNQKPKANYDAQSVEELRQTLTDPLKRAVGGDLSGYQ